jgi:hypothetical protein
MEHKHSVSSVEDNSSKDNINIIIKLKTGSAVSVEEFCLLKKRMNKNLNVIKDNVVCEYTTYNDILRTWFDKRQETYVKRFERLRAIIRLRIIYIKEVIRFVEENNKYNFSVLDEETAVAMLKRDKYITFNKSLLDNPEFTSVGNMEFAICGKNASYDYLFAIGPRQRMEAARVARAKKLIDMEAYYAAILKDDIVKTTWLAELSELNTIIIKGTTHEKGWLYGEKKVVFN